MELPKDVQDLLDRLNEAGYAAYAVGGCVRDTVLGRTPGDWDLCTSALPEQMQAVFAGEHVVETGLRHGTLTVVLHHVPYEVTTFRVDGTYTDHRHPDAVSFVDRVDQDLARRDFTVNAMAYSPRTGMVDLFGGQRDLKEKTIRCVGNPDLRFEEDALRILRALRFAAVYDFSVEEETAAAIHRLYPSLEKVAPERIRTELFKLLCGPSAGRILREYRDVIFFLLPELKPMEGLDQRNPHHLYDVWEHTVRAVEAVAPETVLRLTVLLHDTGKPAAMSTDETDIGHFYGHEALSESLAEQALDRLKPDNVTREAVCTLVRHHSLPLSPERPVLLKRLNRLGEAPLRNLIRVQAADLIATGTRPEAEVRSQSAQLESALEALMAERPCFTLKSLAVNGRDLAALGFRGPDIGQNLQSLLAEVMEGHLPNEKETLLRWLKQKNAAGKACSAQAETEERTGKKRD